MARIPVGYVRADTDGHLYRREDTEWLIEPSLDDPGVLGPKLFAFSLEQLEAKEFAHEQADFERYQDARWGDEDEWL